MTFLPIVGRELRVTARRRATYWMRTIIALAAIAAGVIVYLYNRVQPKEFGQSLFMTLSVLAFLYCLVSGIILTADCLSEEKREGTLGLLFLTDLKGYDVVFGKLFATSLNGFYGSMAIFPVLAIPLLMGGITNGEFWRMVLVLLVTFLFSLSMGLLVSSLSKSPRKAILVTFFLIFFFAAGLPILTTIPSISRSPRLESLLWTACPFRAFYYVFDKNYGPAFKLFWWSVGTMHGLTWIFLIFSAVIVPLSWQDKPAGSRTALWRERLHRWNYGNSTERRVFRSTLLDINAFYWLAARARSKSTQVWLLFAGIACIWAWGCIKVGNDWFNEFIYVTTALILNSIIKIWLTFEAGRRLGEDRKSGALEWLLSTPLTVSEILKGQWLALRRQFLGPVMVLIFVEFVFLIAPLKNAGGEETGAYVFMWIAGICMLVMDLIALGWISMWAGLTSKNLNRAALVSIAKVMVLPWCLWFGLILMATIIQFSNSRMGDWKFLIGSWLFLGIIVNLFFGIIAKRKLHSEFRLVAMHRFTPPATIGTGTERPKTSAPNLPPVVAA